jgi:hypothetical protein
LERRDRGVLSFCTGLPLEGYDVFHEKIAATMHRMSRSKHNPLTSQVDIPANPQSASKAATTARIMIVTAHDNIFYRGYGLKRAITAAAI